MIELKPGHRIELTSMPNDPSPVTVGTQGTVRHINNTPGCTPGCDAQVDVAWDSGKTLFLLHGIDKYRIIGTAECAHCNKQVNVDKPTINSDPWGRVVEFFCNETCEQSAAENRKT